MTPTSESRVEPPWVPKVRELRHHAVQAVLNQLATRRNRGLRTEHSQGFDLRDSLLYRAQSVGFHVDLLRRHFEHFEAQSALTLQDDRRGRQFLMDCRNILTYLSDDVLFHAISMLDYVGNFTGYLHRGQDCSRLKWNGLVRSARDKNNPLAITSAGQVAIASDTEWIDRLQKVRSEIIHEQMKLGNGTQTLTFLANRLTIRLSFELSGGVVRRLPFLLTESDAEGRVELVAGIETVALRALDAANEITAALVEDFKR